jgi:hypothetical protein
LNWSVPGCGRKLIWGFSLVVLFGFSWNWKFFFFKCWVEARFGWYQGVKGSKFGDIVVGFLMDLSKIGVFVAWFAWFECLLNLSSCSTDVDLKWLFYSFFFFFWGLRWLVCLILAVFLKLEDLYRDLSLWNFRTVFEFLQALKCLEYCTWVVFYLFYYEVCFTLLKFLGFAIWIYYL